MTVTLAELAHRFGGEVRGDGQVRITGVATLERAGPSEIAYVESARYRQALAGTGAGAVILRPGDAACYEGTAWLTERPRLCFAQVAALLHPRAFEPGIHPLAAVDPRAKIAKTAYVGPHAVVEADAEIGEQVHVGAGCYLGPRAQVGRDSFLAPGVSVLDGCVIGQRCVLQPGVVIGSDGFGYVQDAAQWTRIPQIGRVILGDDVDIGANTTVDRGALADTVIGDRVKLDNLIQIAHNVTIGEDTIMAGCVGIAGSAIIGKRCRIGGGTGIAGHLEIGDDVNITAYSLVVESVPPGSSYSGSLPAQAAGEWRRNAVRFHRLDELARRVKTLEQQIQLLLQGKDL